MMQLPTTSPDTRPAPGALHPAFDWHAVARLALLSRALDEYEEAHDFVKYQFAARGHELGQVLLAQLLDRPHDAASVYYRSRPFMLGCGLTPTEAYVAGMARAGSMSDGRDVGVVFNLPPRGGPTVLPSAADVGSQFTPAVGWAQAIRYRCDVLGEQAWADSIVVVFGGDGAVASNGFWSALNIATTLELPLLFVIEDNGYAISVKGPLQTPGANIAANLAAFANLTVWDGNGSDPATTAALVAEAVAHVRGGRGVGLLRLRVPRLSGHSSVDNQAYKSDAERAREAARDPLPALRACLVPTLYSAAEWAALKAAAEQAVRDAHARAELQPEADRAAITRHVWHDPANPAAAGGRATAGLALPPTSDLPNPPLPNRINMVEAIRRTLESELARNPRVLLFGEDVGYKGGVHAATLGLQKQFGAARVFDTSLSEEGIIGRAVGMALAGLMPVPEIQFRKYADPATEQLNNCGTVRWRSANHFAAPVVVRIPGGYRKLGDPWHSVTSEVTFVHTPGWLVAVPSNAEDAVGLLRTALRGEDPVIFFEHRAMYDAAWARRPYPGDDFALPFGRARLTQTGDRLTIVTWGAMVELCERAVATLGASADVIDLRTLLPWDIETVLQSVRKTSKVLVVHEDGQTAGFGAEIAATIVDQAFGDLDAPVRRVASPVVPVPYSQHLMAAVVPGVERITAAVGELLAY